MQEKNIDKKIREHCLKCNRRTTHKLILIKHGLREGLYYRCSKCSYELFYGEVNKSKRLYL